MPRTGIGLLAQQGWDKAHSAAFVVPFYGDQEFSVRYLSETIDGFDRQTDPNWRAIIVDDATPRTDARDYLGHIERERGDRIHVIWLERNSGHGHARNVAVRYAAEQGYPYILYNDADDISHPERVEVLRKLFASHPLVDLIYSTFAAIDENRRPLPDSAMVAADYLAVQRSRPIVGKDAWIRIGLECSTSLPSSTALRTSAALACPSPVETPSEGIHQWMHISAAGGGFLFTPDIPTLYRVTSSVSGTSHHRRRMGTDSFYKNMVKVRTAGFINALRVAASRGHWCSDQADQLMTLFYLRLADTLAKVGQTELAEDALKEGVMSAYPWICKRMVVALA